MPKIARTFLPALFVVLLIVTAITIKALPAGATNTGPTFVVMNTSESPPDGVWFRNSPHNSDTDRVNGHGVYMNDTVQLSCYAWGDAVGPYADRLWYYAYNLTRPTVPGTTRSNEGYLNAHYINDGKAANVVDSGVPLCGSTPPTPTPTSSGGSDGYESSVPTATAETFCPGTSVLCQAAEGSVQGAVHMVCWQDATWTDGKSHRWFYIQAPNGSEGFVHAGSVASQITTPNCTTISWINAAAWALGQDGQWKVPANAKNGNTVTYWSSWCWLFSYDSWKLGAGHTPVYSAPTAQQVFNLYKSNGRMYAASSLPPRGALVFFSFGNVGHVAVSLGDGQIETTQGYKESQMLKVTHKTLTQEGLTELGYVPPALA